MNNLPNEPAYYGLSEDLNSLSTTEFQNFTSDLMMSGSQGSLLQSDTLDDLLAIAHAENIQHLMKHPTLTELDTEYKFEVTLNSESSGKTSWMYSSKMKKVFIKMGQTINVDISYIPFSQSLYLRIMIVYTNELHTPVIRCNNHRVQGEKEDLSSPHIIPHILRCLNGGVNYEGVETGAYFGDRLSCRVPLTARSEAVLNEPITLNFVCQNSCSSGMNRRPTTIIFTLEKENQEVVGKKIMHFKVCSCPKRDKEKEEGSFESQSVKRKGGSDNSANGKRPCKVMVPVNIKTEPMISPDHGLPNSPGYNFSSLPENKEITVTLTLPDNETMNYVLDLARTKVLAKMALSSNPEQYTKYKDDIECTMESIKLE